MYSGSLLLPLKVSSSENGKFAQSNVHFWQISRLLLSLSTWCFVSSLTYVVSCRVSVICNIEYFCCQQPPPSANAGELVESEDTMFADEETGLYPYCVDFMPYVMWYVSSKYNMTARVLYKLQSHKLQAYGVPISSKYERKTGCQPKFTIIAERLGIRTCRICT